MIAVANPCAADLEHWRRCRRAAPHQCNGMVERQPDGGLRLNLFPWQQEMVHTQDRALWVVGGYGSAKTEGLAAALVLDCLANPGTLNCAAAYSNPVLLRTQIPAITRFCETALPQGSWIHLQTKKQFRFSNGSAIQLQTCDVQPAELKGPEYGVVGIEEAELVPEAHFEILDDRIRRPNVRRCLMVVSNSPPMAHWTARHFHEKPRAGYRYRRVSSYRNPYLPKSYLRKLREKYPPGTVAHRRYVLGEIGVPLEGAVFVEFGEQHILDEIPDPSRIIGYVAGMDFGAGHPTAYMVAAVTKDDDLIIIGEHVAQYLRVAEHWERISPIRPAGTVVFADHDLQLRIEYEGVGLRTEPAPKHIGEDRGFELIRARLAPHWQVGRPRLFFLRNGCPKLISRMQTHVHGQKLWDDEVDALRYLVTGYDLADETLNLLPGGMDTEEHLAHYRR